MCRVRRPPPCSSDWWGTEGPCGARPGTRLTWLSAQQGSPCHPGPHSCKRERERVPSTRLGTTSCLIPASRAAPEVGVAGLLSPFNKGRNWAKGHQCSFCHPTGGSLLQPVTPHPCGVSSGGWGSPKGAPSPEAQPFLL